MISSESNLEVNKANGIKWTTIGMIAKVVVQIITTALLARLLTPAEFGIMALARIFLQFGSYISNAGINRALIQKSRLDEKDISAAVSLTVILGFSSCFLMLIISPLAGVIYKNYAITTLICVTAVSYIFSALSMTGRGLLQREMRFKEITIADVFSYSIGYSVITVLLAWRGCGVWSIAVGTITQNLLMWVCQWLFHRYSLRPGWDKQAVRHLLEFGGGVTVISIFEYIGGSLDVIISGKLWTADVVGFYTKASQLVTLPIEYISNALITPVFPAMCEVKDDLERLRREYITNFLLICVVEFSVCIGMAFASYEAVYIMLGDQWLSIVGIFSILCIAHAFNYSNTVLGMTLEATGRLKEKLFLQWSQIFILAVGIFLLRSFGMTGVAYAMLTAQIYKFFGIQVIVNRILNWSYTNTFRVLGNLVYIIMLQVCIQLIASLIISKIALPVSVCFLIRVISGGIALMVGCVWLPTSMIREHIDLKKMCDIILSRKK